MPTAYEIVRQAIIDKRQIIADYNGCRREMCPHSIGTKNGRPQALFFQFAGDSNSGLPPDGEWRCIPIDGLSNVIARNGAWHTGINHSRPQSCVGDIDEEVVF
jgi:hypothetical protein